MKKRPHKESKDRKALRSVLLTYEFNLMEARRKWDDIVKQIRTNENQMNPFGIWQSTQLDDLRYLRTAIVLYNGVVTDMKRALGEE
jgi:hypothetical protein